MKKVFFLIVLAITFLTACSNNASYDTIQIDEVSLKQADGFIVLDVREIHEYETGHIIGAKNKPLSLLQNGDFEGLNKKEKYIVICRTGNRSQQASELLLKEGYNFVNVAQGMSSWKGVVE